MLNNIDLQLSKLKGLCRKYVASKTIAEEISTKQLLDNQIDWFENLFKDNPEGLFSVQEYIDLCSNPLNVITTPDEELDIYYTRLIDLQRLITVLGSK